MSQHFLNTNGLHILMGWDRPLQYYFLLIQSDAQAAEESDVYLYSNLDDSNSETYALLDYVEILERMGARPHDNMLNEILADAKANTGNKCVYWDAEGNRRTGTDTPTTGQYHVG
jgi:uncharacterized protein (DUF924 family)